jgi:hypothetical protein
METLQAWMSRLINFCVKHPMQDFVQRKLPLVEPHRI